MRMDATLSLCRDENVLIINDVRLDLGTYKAGDSDWIIGEPAQNDGVWQVKVVFPHGPNARKNLLFPKPILVQKNGPIKKPSTRSRALKPA